MELLRREWAIYWPATDSWTDVESYQRAQELLEYVWFDRDAHISTREVWVTKWQKVNP